MQVSIEEEQISKYSEVGNCSIDFCRNGQLWPKILFLKLLHEPEKK